MLANTVTAYLPATANYSYDSNGNLLSDGTRNFAYDDENQLVSVWQTNVWREDYVYDGLMRRRIETNSVWNGSTWVATNVTHYVYDGNLVLQERSGDNVPLVTYTRGDDLSHSLQGAGGIGGLLARTDMGQWIGGSAFATAYYFSDENGNVMNLIYTNGLMAAQYHYDPYGNLLAMSGPLAEVNHYRFSSKEWDGNVGLYYYGYRFYDPNLQRWVNRDLMEELGGYNLYAFISNVAVNAVDAFGLCDDNSNKDLSPKNPFDHFLNSNSPWNPITLLLAGVDPKASSLDQLKKFGKTAGKGLLNNSGVGDTLKQWGNNIQNDVGLGSGNSNSNPFSIGTGDKGESVNWNINADPTKPSVNANLSCSLPFGLPGKVVFSGDIETSKFYKFNDPVEKVSVEYNLKF